MVKITLEALDNKVVTRRTGKSKVRGDIRKLPQEGDYLMIIFDEEEKTESPGVYVAINGLEIIGNEYRFSDDGKRPFKISIDS